MRLNFVSIVMILVAVSIFTIDDTAFAVGKQLRTTTQGANKKLNDAQAECQQSDYEPKTNPGKKMPDCQKCRSELDKWKDKIRAASEKAYTTNDSLTASAAGMISSLGGSANGQQQSSENTSGSIDSLARGVQNQLSSNASGLAGEYKRCSSEIKDACSGSLAEKDKKAGEDGSSACQDGEKGAESTAADKAGSGMDLGQLAQLASGFGQALGALKEQPQPNSSVSDPSPPVPQAPEEAQLSAAKISADRTLGPKVKFIQNAEAERSVQSAPPNEFPSMAKARSGLSVGFPLEEKASTDHQLPNDEAPGSFAGNEVTSAAAANFSSRSESEILSATAAAILPRELGNAEVAGSASSAPRPLIGLRGGSDLSDLSEDGAPPSSLGSVEELGLNAVVSPAEASSSLDVTREISLFAMVKVRISEIQKRGGL